MSVGARAVGRLKSGRARGERERYEQTHVRQSVCTAVFGMNRSTVDQSIDAGIVSRSDWLSRLIYSVHSIDCVRHRQTYLNMRTQRSAWRASPVIESGTSIWWCYEANPVSKTWQN